MANSDAESVNTYWERVRSAKVSESEAKEGGLTLENEEFWPSSSEVTDSVQELRFRASQYRPR